MADLNAQTFGLKAPVSTKPQGSPSSTQTTGAEYQTVGTTVPLNHGTTNQSPASVASKGTYQKIGDCVDLNQTPIKSIGNNSKLPFSERAVAASNVPTAKAKPVHL